MHSILGKCAAAVLVYSCFVANSYGAVDRATCMTALGVPAGDCDALVALYNSTNGDSWIDNTNWGTVAAPWLGVTVSGSRVAEIELFSNYLTGSIPPELGNLGNLLALRLYLNQLTGPIPPELGNLSNLTELWLNSNQLTSPIPVELGNLSVLDWLYLNNNHLDADADGNALIPPAIQTWYDGITNKNISNQTLSEVEPVPATAAIPTLPSNALILLALLMTTLAVRHLRQI